MMDSYKQARRMTLQHIAVMICISLLLGVLHIYYSDFKSGGVYWFNLDKERNIPTWYSGLLFLMFGLCSIAAYLSEVKVNQKQKDTFRLPVMWLGVGIIGVMLSLDESTILHENLFWKEVRQASDQMGGAWRYVTQWQLLFAPVILGLFSYFVLFFYNRYSCSRRAWYCAFSGMGCWVLALSLEGIRQAMKFNGGNAYDMEMVLEEELEMIGAILLLASIVYYSIDITFDFSETRRAMILRHARIFSKKALAILAAFLIIMAIAGGVVYLYANYMVSQDAPIAELHKKANKPD